MSKSVVTNLIAALLMLGGFFMQSHIIFNIGLFAFSGAITNWLAIHMLFEKVPGLYGSGVIPARFEEFKGAILTLIMEQFFTDKNIERFLSNAGNGQHNIDLAPVIEKLDLSPSFDALVNTVEQSSFGGMLSMFGGVEALQPMKTPFIEKMKQSLTEVAQSDKFNQLLIEQIETPNMLAKLREKVEQIVIQRLNELTPQMVKEIVQQMIKVHLGWLVVWGGVFGGLIGLIAALV